MKQLLEAGAHFGHQTGRWHPRMKDYIFTKRNGIHIIDLEKTLALPAGRLGRPEDLGAAVLYLCSPAGEWVTGQCIRVAGTP